jgi:hypothetical protein
MGQKENSLIKKRLGSLDPWTRLFRINSGQFWAGKILPNVRKDVIVLKNPSRIQGAPTGFSDCVGGTSVVITEEMVGQRVLIFTAEEFKATGGLSKEQKLFGQMIERLGGIFRVIRSEADFPSAQPPA